MIGDVSALLVVRKDGLNPGFNRDNRWDVLFIHEVVCVLDETYL